MQRDRTEGGLADGKARARSSNVHSIPPPKQANPRAESDLRDDCDRLDQHRIVPGAERFRSTCGPAGRTCPSQNGALISDRGSCGPAVFVGERYGYRLGTRSPDDGCSSLGRTVMVRRGPAWLGLSSAVKNKEAQRQKPAPCPTDTPIAQKRADAYIAEMGRSGGLSVRYLAT